METFGLFLSTILMFLFDYFPVLVVWLAGLVLSIVNRNKYPKVTRLTVIGLTIFFMISLVNTYVSRMLPIWLTQWGYTTDQMVPVFTIKNLIVSVVSALGWGFVITAIFSGRDTSVKSNKSSISKNVAL